MVKMTIQFATITDSCDPHPVFWVIDTAHTSPDSKKWTLRDSTKKVQKKEDLNPTVSDFKQGRWWPYGRVEKLLREATGDM